MVYAWLFPYTLSISPLTAPQERVAELLRRQHNSGKRISIEIRKNRDYRNPYFLEKMVAFYGVDGVATAFSPDVFDPHALPEEDYAQVCFGGRCVVVQKVCCCVVVKGK